MSKKVFVGLSGGVDSSVAALQLLQQGYDVVGVFIKVWHPEFLPCNWEQERRDAMRVAAHLGIPFLTCDAEAAYKNQVADYFITEYQAGRTPNPDVMCNKYVKFGTFMQFAEEHNADYVATGHYAQVRKDSSEYQLLRGIDDNKDQSYFLWTLTQTQLNKVLLPVGSWRKEDIRAYAEKHNIPTANKRDSQGICFLGQVDIESFLKEFIPIAPGNVCAEDGTVIGNHNGAITYTIGQRHGFVITNHQFTQKALYIQNIDPVANTITVGETEPKILSGTELKLANCNQIIKWRNGDEVDIQTRYRQKPIPGVILSSDNQSAIVKLNTDTTKPAIGQSCVLYKGSICLGGGIINS